MGGDARENAQARAHQAATRVWRRGRAEPELVKRGSRGEKKKKRGNVLSFSGKGASARAKQRPEGERLVRSAYVKVIDEKRAASARSL